MTALFSHTKTPARVTISLTVNASQSAHLTGPQRRTLTIPKDGGPLLIGRASTSPTKDRRLYMPSHVEISRYHFGSWWT